MQSLTELLKSYYNGPQTVDDRWFTAQQLLGDDRPGENQIFGLVDRQKGGDQEIEKLASKYEKHRQGSFICLRLLFMFCAASRRSFLSRNSQKKLS